MKKVLLASAILSLVTIVSCSSGDDTKMYNVKVSVTPNATGTISPSADSIYEEGQTISLNAIASDTYSFSGWSGDKESTSNPLSIKVDQNYSLIANFVLKQYQLAITTNGEGTVSEKVLEQMSKEYEHGTVVELTATPAKGWKFKEWQGAITSPDNPIQITVEKPEEVTAVFEKKIYDLTVNTSGDGAVQEEVIQQKTSSHKYGTVVKLTASPSKGWMFSEWSGDQVGSENPVQITVDTTKEVTANFEKKYFAVNIGTQGEGTVTKNPDQSEYIYNSTLDLTAYPARGYQFLEWKGDISTNDNPISITVDTTKAITAVFEKKSYPLTINTSGEGTVTKVPDQSEYKFKSQVDLTATPSQGWEFVGWEGDTTSTQLNLQVVVDEAKEITAVFEPIPYTVDITLSGSGSVSKELISGSTLADGYTYGSKVRITIVEPLGWNFVYWDGDLTGTENPIDVIISDSVSATANMDESPFAGGNGSQMYPYEVSTLDQLQVIRNYSEGYFIQINDIDAYATSSWDGGQGFRPIGDSVLRFRGVFDGKGFEVANLHISRGDSYIGLFGFADGATLRNIILRNVSITGINQVGGLVGRTNMCNIENAFVSGNIKGSTFVGGLVGWNRDGKVQNAKTNSSVIGTYRDTGGLIGRNEVGEIINSASLGTVKGEGSVGGLIGVIAVHGSVVNSYSHSTVEGNNEVGGLVGTNNYLYNEPSQIIKSFATGKVTAIEDFGGLVGLNAGRVLDSYWDKETTGQVSPVGRGGSDGITGLTTSQMNGSNAETNMTALDWANIWVTTGGYPALFWE